jgi:hypothetical protein
MATGLVNMSSQFQGLPMQDLIGGPLGAACTSQIQLANATADFIQKIGFLPEKDAQGNVVPGKTRTASFTFDRPSQDPDTGDIIQQKVELEVPMLAIVKVPNLAINQVDITFDMEVKSSTSTTESEDKEASLDATVKVGWGVFSVSATIHGSVSSHKENTRTSDNSAKYHVEVHAQDSGPPEGLMRVLDILQTACVPKAITPASGSGSTTTTTTT